MIKEHQLIVINEEYTTVYLLHIPVKIFGEWAKPQVILPMFIHGSPCAVQPARFVLPKHNNSTNVNINYLLCNLF